MAKRGRQKRSGASARNEAERVAAATQLNSSGRRGQLGQPRKGLEGWCLRLDQAHGPAFPRMDCHQKFNVQSSLVLFHSPQNTRGGAELARPRWSGRELQL